MVPEKAIANEYIGFLAKNALRTNGSLSLT
jgi:hypothetical protein